MRDGTGAQRRWLSEWLMEFSVLWAVFPLLDQVIDRRHGMDWLFIAGGILMALTTALLGILLQRENER